MIEGALILLAGVLVGRFLPGRRRKLKPMPERKPVCGCGHGLHDHDEDGCKAQVCYDRLLGSWRQCTCRKYVGPQPLPEFFAPEISG